VQRDEIGTYKKKMKMCKRRKMEWMKKW
jgi:hypothetical protein